MQFSISLNAVYNPSTWAYAQSLHFYDSNICFKPGKEKEGCVNEYKSGMKNGLATMLRRIIYT